jgi:hypothetical protein
MNIGRILSRHRALWRTGVAAAVLAFACGDDDATTSGCTPGYEGCACAEGNVCLANLACSGGTCVDPSASTTNNTTNATGATTDTDPTGGQSETDGGEPTFCEDASECPDDQICGESECVDATTWWYDLSVDTWNPNECAGLDFSEIYFKVKVDGVTQLTSGTSDCPGSWLAQFAAVRPDWIVELELWRVDVDNGDQQVTSFCFRDDADNCSTIPAKVLHDAGFSGPDGTSYISLSLYPQKPL